MKNRDYHARITVYGLPNYDKRLVKRLAVWLRQQAEQLEKEPKAYSSKYVARLMK